MHKPSDSAAITLVDIPLASDTLVDMPRVDFEEHELAWFRKPVSHTGGAQ